VTEYLRRRNATPQTVIVPEMQAGEVADVKKSFLATPPPGP